MNSRDKERAEPETQLVKLLQEYDSLKTSYEKDITERKQAEEALAQEQYLLHTLMDNLPDHIYFKDL